MVLIKTCCSDVAVRRLGFAVNAAIRAAFENDVRQFNKIIFRRSCSCTLHPSIEALEAGNEKRIDDNIQSGMTSLVSMPPSEIEALSQSSKKVPWPVHQCSRPTSLKQSLARSRSAFASTNLPSFILISQSQ